MHLLIAVKLSPCNILCAMPVRWESIDRRMPVPWEAARQNINLTWGQCHRREEKTFARRRPKREWSNDRPSMSDTAYHHQYLLSAGNMSSQRRPISLSYHRAKPYKGGNAVDANGRRQGALRYPWSDGTDGEVLLLKRMACGLPAPAGRAPMKTRNMLHHQW